MRWFGLRAAMALNSRNPCRRNSVVGNNEGDDDNNDDGDVDDSSNFGCCSCHNRSNDSEEGMHTLTNNWYELAFREGNSDASCSTNLGSNRRANAWDDGRRDCCCCCC